MENDIISADIIDYIGKYEDGILVLLSIGYKGNYTEGTIYYTNEDLVLTVDKSIEEDLKCYIEDWSGYQNLIESILKKLSPYNQMISTLKEVDFSKYFSNNEIEDNMDSKNE